MTPTMRLLLIDDDELDRLTVTRALKRSSLTVEIIEAKTASEGLQFALEQRFDAILLDYSLPDRNGLEVLQMLRAGNSSNSAIIMLTRREDDTLATRCIDAGAQDFLLKDEVNTRRLSRAIRQAQQIHSMGEELRSSHERLRNLAEHDTLTGLANRYSLEVALQNAIARAQRKQGSLAVMLLDLDGFKAVNDTLGHDVGDSLLQKVAQRLLSAVRGSDLLARLGGDEFVVLAQDMERDDQAGFLAERVLASLQAPIVVGAVELRVTTSIGVAVLEHGAGAPTDLLKCADIAMYRAKASGRNQVYFYSESLHETIQRRAAIERDLKQALARGQFKLHYQAQMAAASKQLVSIEALLRWEHPERGLLLPDDFIGIAEEMDLINPIGEWVLRTACLQMSEWRQLAQAANRHISIAVNLSTLQMRGNKLVTAVGNALTDSGLPANCLELEFTEHALIANPQHVALILEQLAAFGVVLTLDDFGTGYASMQHLKLFPIRILKIDPEFVSAIGQGSHHERLLAAIIRFAQALNLIVVAEGVETREQAAFCQQVGCDRLQGYYYARPVPAEAFMIDTLSCAMD